MKAPSIDPAPIRQHGTRIRLERPFRVITPMFGGGARVESDENKRHIKGCDGALPVRAAAIRGHLRFWWRVVCGSQLESLHAMREQEARIWGLASQPGDVAIALTGSFSSEPVDVFEVREANGRWNPRPVTGREGIAYGAFPLQPRAGLPQRVEPGTLHRIQGDGVLELSMSRASEPDVRSAVAAWLAFGGVGGRTRRGFGAVSAGPVDPRQVFGSDRTGSIPGVDSLLRLGILGPATRPTVGADPVDLLEAALSKLRTFRQGVDVGRERGRGPRPGRSRWPEPNAIRRLTRPQPASGWRHDPTVGPQVNKFPRAAFGMPIEFKFKDDNPNQPPSDPAKTRLLPVGCQRRASPLILRPYEVARGQYGALALLLEDPARHDELVEVGGIEGPQSHTLTTSEARSLSPLRGQHDPLVAFLCHFES